MGTNPPLALACAFLCSYAYDKARVEPAAYSHKCCYAWKWPAVYRCLSDWKRFDCPDTDVHVLFAYRESDRTAFVAFRGTDSWKDALADLAVIPRALPCLQDTDPEARVHGGFFLQHRAAFAAVLEYLDRHPDRASTVVTGHSLGGAVATLCATRLKDERGEQDVRCLVLGCPRVGNAAFVSRVDRMLDVRSFVVGHDPVTNIPTRVRWRHAGRRVWYVNGRRVKSAQGDPWYRAACVPNLLCLLDHAVAGYIDSIARDKGGDEPSGESGCWWLLGTDDIYLTLLALVGLLAAVLAR